MKYEGDYTKESIIAFIREKIENAINEIKSEVCWLFPLLWYISLKKNNDFCSKIFYKYPYLTYAKTLKIENEKTFYEIIFRKS